MALFIERLSALLSPSTPSGTAPWSLLALGFLAGALTTTIAPALLKFVFLAALRKVLLVEDVDTAPRAHKSSRRANAKIYALHHAVLNLTLPPETMWMNMGYWKTLDSTTASMSRPSQGHDTPSFPQACESLLVKVLHSAGILSPTHAVQKQEQSGKLLSSARRQLRIVDVGVGCGDQSLFLTNLLSAPTSSTQYYSSEHRESAGEYIGITIDPQQHAYATQRMSAAVPGEKGCKWQVFCADAADPPSWPDDLVHTLHHTSSATTTTTKQASRTHEHDPQSETWVLGLDCLYHFGPSRQALFNYTARDLRASIAAFDLVLPNPPTPHHARASSRRSSQHSRGVTRWKSFILRFLALLLNVPCGNFVTEDEYRAQLVRAGYHASDVSVEDISGDVFPGLAGYIERRSEEVGIFVLPGSSGGGGGKGGLGPLAAYTVFSWVLRWWARTGVVRGVVVVARYNPK